MSRSAEEGYEGVGRVVDDVPASGRSDGCDPGRGSEADTAGPGGGVIGDFGASLLHKQPSGILRDLASVVTVAS